MNGATSWQPYGFGRILLPCEGGRNAAQLTPFRTGAAFALTVAILYLACLLLMLLAPGMVLSVFSTWVHGLNLEPLTTNPPPIDVRRALLGLLLISGYAFIAGSVYGFARRWLTPR